MHRLIQYTILFVVLLMVQIFLLNGINLSPYIYPMAYVGFILLLPMESMPVVVLMMGVLMGTVTDLAMGTAGLNSIATILTAFSRPYILTLIVGQACTRDGGVPTPNKIGVGKFLRYVVLMVLIHCLVYFSFEAMSWDFYYLTLLKVALSTIVTTILVYITSLLLTGNE